MEMIMNTIDTVLVVVDIVEAIIALSQREDVRKLTAKFQQVVQAAIIVIGLASIVMICLSVSIVQAIYREWQAVLPVALAAFREGYNGESSVALIEASDQPSIVMPAVPVKPSTAKLRSDCQTAGIKWRNAHGKNKHLTVPEMLIVLEQADVTIGLVSRTHAA
jgi:hypothetical protein